MNHYLALFFISIAYYCVYRLFRADKDFYKEAEKTNKKANK